MTPEDLLLYLVLVKRSWPTAGAQIQTKEITFRLFWVLIQAEGPVLARTEQPKASYYGLPALKPERLLKRLVPVPPRGPTHP